MACQATPLSLPPALLLGTSNSLFLAKAASEWFLKGTETSTVQPVSSPANFRIVYPVSGAIIALDPDIPHDQQKVFFESHPKDDRLNWRLDGKEIGRAGSVLLWTPLKGKHNLCLIDEMNRTLDSVEFEVRGNLHVSSSTNLPSSLEARSIR